MQSKALIDELLRQKSADKEIPGVVAMAANGNEVIYQGAYGKRDLSKDDAMTADSVFWIASMTKAITAAGAMQLVEHYSLAGINVLQIKRPVRAFDDLGGAIVTPDALNERVIRFARIFGDEDVARAPQIARRLAQSAAREQEFVTERRLSVHQDHVEPMFKMQILQAIIEQQCVNVPFVDCEPAAFYAVFVHEDDHVSQVMRQHVRFVAGS